MLKWFLNHEDQFPLLGVFVGWIFQALVAQNVGAAVRVVYSVQAATFKVRESLALLATQLIWFDAEKVEHLLIVKLNLNHLFFGVIYSS